MKKIILILFSISALSSLAFADCQLGEACHYFDNDIMLAPPYLGTYKCTLDPGSMDNVSVEIRLLTSNTISEPSTLVLSNDKKSDTTKVLRHSPPSSREYLVNAFRVTPTSTAICEETASNPCDVPSTVMCEQLTNTTH